MDFYGLQKLSLLDFPGKVACTLFTGGCPMRCPFCHNASLLEPLPGAACLPEGEALAFLAKRQGILDGVCVSGGEPLLQKGLPEFLKAVKSMGFSIKIDTNGMFPKRLQALAESGLVDYVAMDIKNSLKKYAGTAGLLELDTSKIEESAAYLLRGGIPYEFRTTAVENYHSPEDFEAIGKWLKGARQYYIQPFRDSAAVLQKGLSAPGECALRQYLQVVSKYIPNAQLRGL
jgi:pyruvate formate lyase activating enzyme